MTATTDLPTKLCSWQKECPECQGMGETHYPDDKESRQPCVSCHGTGWVYVLDDSVRMPCKCAVNISLALAHKYTAGNFGNAICQECHKTYQVSWADRDKAGHSNVCVWCAGSGWIPSTDLAVWIKAAWVFFFATLDGGQLEIWPAELGKWMIWDSGNDKEVAEGDTLLDALQSALVQVMEKEQA